MQIFLKENEMKLYKQTVIAALMLGATVTLSAQLAHAQSTGQTDCNNQKATSAGCPPAVNPTPPPPVVTPNPPAPPATPPAVNGNPVPPAAPPTPQKNTSNRFDNNQSSGWRYDQNRHNRRNQRDNIFRFSFGGFFYDRPYWQQQQYYYQPNRISCGEGRFILADSGYKRIRTVECNGTTFTYKAQRGTRTYRVYVNSRRGSITGVTRIY
jgi:type IV secretory pathway VirB10-like protein